MDSRTFHRLVIKNHRVDSSERLQFLKKVPLLQGLILESLAKMADALQVVSFEKDARIINEGEKALFAHASSDFRKETRQRETPTRHVLVF